MQVRPDVLVRIARHRGASDALYRGPDAEARIDFGDASCPARRSPSTPTPSSAPTVTASTTGTPSEQRSATATRASGPPEDDGTTTDGTPEWTTTGSDGAGFTVPVALAGLLALALLRRRRP